MATPEIELLIEKVTSPFRERNTDGQVKSHHAWHDLDEEGRLEAFAVTETVRAIEAALDPRGESGTVKAVLARIRGARS